jgi:PAS domain S-box-containing protein
VTERSSSGTAGDAGAVQPQEVLDRLPAAVVVCDTALRCRYANPAALRWLGRASPEQVLGRGLRELLAADVYAATLPRARAALAGVPQRSTRVLVDGRGEPRHVDVGFVPLVRDGTVTGFLVQVVDTTEQVRAGAELRRASVAAAVAGERERVAVGVAQLISRSLHGASLEITAALQSGAATLEDRLRAALRHLDAAVHEARRLALPAPVPGSGASAAADDRELRRTRVLLDQLLQLRPAGRAAVRPPAGRRSHGGALHR